MKIWVAVAPDGTVILPSEDDNGGWKARAIRKAREHATLDYEIRERTDLISYLSWTEAKSEGYRVRQATITLSGQA